MPSNTSEYLPRPAQESGQQKEWLAFGEIDGIGRRSARSKGRQTNLPYNLVVLENAPACDRLACIGEQIAGTDSGRAGERPRSDQERRTNVNTVIVPVTTGHVLIDIGVDSSHTCDGGGAWTPDDVAS
jgi:hypothetical protein